MRSNQMIKKLTVQEIARMSRLDDNVESFFPCDKGEWIQFLIKNVEHPNLFIWGDVVGNTIKAYAVAINSVQPPLSNSVTLLMHYSNNAFDSTMALKEELNKWAKEKGAKRVLFIVNTESDMTSRLKFGVEQKGILGGWDI